MQIKDILNGNNLKAKRALFAFSKSDPIERIYTKFNLWSRHFFPKYFKSRDAWFHKKMDMGNIKAYIYQGEDDGINQYVNIASRGFAKTARTKLFLAYVIANDMDHYRQFIRCLSADLDNAKQSVTDIFNMLIQDRVIALYPEIWEKNDTKREETMSSFTTSTRVKIIAKQIGVDQRGKIQEDAKADFDWYDDFETKTTIRSVVTTRKIRENMEEARTGLALNGGSIYTCNYFSEMGNVHDLVKKTSQRKLVDIFPIRNSEGKSNWPERYSEKEIDKMQIEDEDFEGERMCSPSASKDIYFDRAQLERMGVPLPLRTIADFKIFKNYNPTHRYGSGHDVAGGVGLDSSASVFIDFDTIPAQVVATYHNNMIQPESFGDEIYNQGSRWGLPIQGVENNKFDQAVLKAKQLGAQLYKTKGKEIKVGYSAPTNYGWNTNSLTKSKMLSAMKLAIEDGLIELNDGDLIEEFRSYTRNDLIEPDPDPRDINNKTRHFDLLIACCIAWQMKDHSTPSRVKVDPEAHMWRTNQSPSRPKKNPAL